MRWRGWAGSSARSWTASSRSKNWTSRTSRPPRTPLASPTSSGRTSRTGSCPRMPPFPRPPTRWTASSPSRGSTKMPHDLLNLTAYELAKAIEAGEVSAREAAEVANARVEEAEDQVNAFLTITPELALERAERVDAKNGGKKLWEGVPIAVKDVLSTRGVRTTCGSRILGNYEPLYDASALANYGEDLVMVGKAN